MQKRFFEMRFWFLALFLMCVGQNTCAKEVLKLPDSVARYAMEKVGQATFEFLFLDIYEATLYAPKGVYTAGEPFALKLTYKKSLKGAAIAKRSQDEMANLSDVDGDTLKRWGDAMLEIFPNVEKGDVIVGVYQPKLPTRFYLNDQFLGQVDDPDFGQHFFDIWLKPRPQYEQFRKKLLNQL